MPRRYRVAIVGAGIGARHLDAYLAHPELFEPAVICDLDPGARPRSRPKPGAARSRRA